MTRGILVRWTITILVTGMLLCPLWSKNEVRFQILPQKQDLAPGSELVLTLRATMAPTWHLYSLTPYPEDVVAAPQPTTIQLREHPFFEPGGEVRQPQPKLDYDENFDIETSYFDGMVDFEVPVRVASTASKGEHEVVLKVRFMACNDRVCLPPQNVEFNTLLVVSVRPRLRARKEPQARDPSRPVE